ncbi:trmH, partial [Symbiodinium pilosum]
MDALNEQSSEIRLTSFAVVVENPSDWNNLDRILKACGVFNVVDIRFIRETTKPQDPRCQKCLDLGQRPDGSGYRIWPSTALCSQELIAEGFLSMATALDESS